jgi:hypothetical protein
LADPQHAPTATTDMHLMPALLTATTVLAGSLAAYLSAPARGMAGDAAGAMAVGDTAGAMAAVGAVATVGASTADAGSLVDGASLVAEATRVVQSAGFTVAEPFTAAVVSTVAAASMAEGAFTVAVVDMAAVDTANPI